MSGCSDNLANIWDLENLGAPLVSVNHGESVRNLAATPDGVWFLSSGQESFKLWPLFDYAHYRTLSGPLEAEYALL